MSIRNIVNDCGKIYEERWKSKFYNKEIKGNPNRLDKLVERFFTNDENTAKKEKILFIK